MSVETKKYKVSILGEVYSLVSDEPEVIVQESLQLVDNLIKDISSKSENLSQEKILVFALIKAVLNSTIVSYELANYKNITNKFTDILNQHN